MGRKKIVIDWKLVDKMLMASCEGTEVAAALGIHPDTLYLRCEKDKKMGFSEYLRQKKAKGDNYLKTKQYQVAMNGDKSMLIWLGKNRLGQSDKVDAKTEVSGGPLQIIVNTKDTADAMKRFSKDD